MYQGIIMELLSPAGNFEKLVTAVTYGADAVYFGGEAFGLRAQAGNFTLEEMKEALEYLHARGKRGYLTVNAYARDYELDELKTYLKTVADIGVDAFIISDPGVFHLAKEAAPQVERHISTQANTTNSAAVAFWKAQGASRVIMARELPQKELESVAKNAPIEIECFVHGAVCISYSGRCLMSAYMTGRDANRGECTQPCRWKYNPPSQVSYIQEVTRKTQDMEMIEEPDGTYLYNAKDLCLIDRVGELAAMGVSSLKIEGRMKSMMYVATTTAVYRRAIDLAMKDPINYKSDPEWRKLLNSVSNRHYVEGFYATIPDKDAMNYETSAYVRTSDFLGVVTNSTPLTVECRGKFLPNEKLEIFTPTLERIEFAASALLNPKGESVANSRAGDILVLECAVNAPVGSILRRNYAKAD
jgi:putative protease